MSISTCCQLILRWILQLDMVFNFTWHSNIHSSTGRGLKQWATHYNFLWMVSLQHSNSVYIVFVTTPHATLLWLKLTCGKQSHRSISWLRLVITTIAFIMLARNAPFSSSWIPTMVVPPGEATWSFSWPQCFPAFIIPWILLHRTSTQDKTDRNEKL